MRVIPAKAGTKFVLPEVDPRLRAADNNGDFHFFG
jgi:hypothetical protein